MSPISSAMHERYTYLLDILLVVLVFLDNKYLKYAVVSVMLNIMTYCHFLFGTPFTLIQWCSIAYIISWSHFTYTLITTSNNNDLMTSMNNKKNIRVLPECSFICPHERLHVQFARCDTHPLTRLFAQINIFFNLVMRQKAYDSWTGTAKVRGHCACSVSDFS